MIPSVDSIHYVGNLERWRGCGEVAIIIWHHAMLQSPGRGISIIKYADNLHNTPFPPKH